MYFVTLSQKKIRNQLYKKRKKLVTRTRGSRIFALAKIFAPSRRIASVRRSAVQMRTSALARQVPAPKALRAPNKKPRHMDEGKLGIRHSEDLCT